jgi:hypothetical protein
VEEDGERSDSVISSDMVQKAGNARLRPASHPSRCRRWSSLVVILHVDLSAKQLAGSSWSVGEFQHYGIDEESLKVFPGNFADGVNLILVDSCDVLDIHLSTDSICKSKK